jgi:MarR family transcriptional regulator for hemolysin
VVRLVDSLEQVKLLQRRRHARDRRVWTLWLTPAGQNAIVDVHRINDKVRGEALAGVSDDDRERLLDALVRLRTSLLQATEADQQEAA